MSAACPWSSGHQPFFGAAFSQQALRTWRQCAPSRLLGELVFGHLDAMHGKPFGCGQASPILHVDVVGPHYLSLLRAHCKLVAIHVMEIAKRIMVSTKRKRSEAVACVDCSSTDVCCLSTEQRSSTVFRNGFLAASFADIETMRSIAPARGRGA